MVERTYLVLMSDGEFNTPKRTALLPPEVRSKQWLQRPIKSSSGGSGVASKAGPAILSVGRRHKTLLASCENPKSI